MARIAGGMKCAWTSNEPGDAELGERMPAGQRPPEPTHSHALEPAADLALASAFASRSAIAWRLSYCFLPRASAISTLARPSLK